jgi:predicted dehydrogenase
MVRLAREARRQLSVSQNYRYSPAVQTLRRLAAEGAAGLLGHGHLDFYLPADFSGTFRETMEYPLLLDMAIHHLDLVRFVTGRDVEKVLAWSFRPEWSWFRHDPGLKLLLELEGGLPFSYSGDWTARGRATTWNGTWRLQCAEGSLHLEDDKVLVGRSEPWNKNPTLEEVELDPITRWHQAATLHEFAEAIRTGKPTPTSGEDNLKSFGTVMAGVTSAREGRAVGVRELLEG